MCPIPLLAGVKPVAGSNLVRVFVKVHQKDRNHNMQVSRQGIHRYAVWLPASQIKVLETTDDWAMIELPAWLAADRSLPEYED